MEGLARTGRAILVVFQLFRAVIVSAAALSKIKVKKVSGGVLLRMRTIQQMQSRVHTVGALATTAPAYTGNPEVRSLAVLSGWFVIIDYTFVFFATTVSRKDYIAEVKLFLDKGADPNQYSYDP